MKEYVRFIKFAVFSASAGMIEIGVFTLLNEISGWSYWPCYLIALLCSILWNFTLNRKFTFRSAANVPVAMMKVVGFYAFARVIFGANVFFASVFTFHRPVGVMNNKPFLSIR